MPFVPPILEAITDRLAGHARIACLGPWYCHKGGEWSLPVRACHEMEPTAGVPSETAWFVVYEPGSNDVRIYPAKVGGISLTFQHQTLNDDGPADRPWRLGNPCLHRPAATFGRQSWNGEPDAPDEKIVWYLERLLLWLDAAATDTLVLDGDPFELPWRPGAASFPVVGFVGADDDLVFWKQRRSDWGWADIAKLPMASFTYAIKRFRDRQSTTIRQPTWGHHISAAPVTHTAIWISLDRLPVLPPWQLPRTWAELSSIVNSSGIDLPTVFEEAGTERRRRTAHGGEHLLILGFPITDRVGLAPSRHHWLAVGSVELSDRKTKRDGFRANEAARRLLDRARPSAKTRLKWLRTASWEPEELRSRSGGSKKLSSLRVLIIGAGALGSAVAENLVRMGITDMGVLDEDILDVGNLTRHALSLDAVGHGKAEALSRALSASMPDASVEGLGFEFPPTDRRLIERLQVYDVVIDCTASDRVLDTMARFDWGGEKIFVSLAMTWQAEALLFFTASESSFPAIDAKERFSKMNVPPADVDGAPMEGIGCWHPVFPATAADVGLWAAIAAKEVMKSVENPRRGCVYFQQMPDGAVVRHDG